MEYIEDSKGQKIPYSYFGNLKEKIDTATGYIGAHNYYASQNNGPQVNIEHAVAKIKKAHAKFYGEQSKYDSKGNLKNV